MNSISAIFFLLAAAVLLSMLQRGADIISPMRIFSFVWCVVFGLTNLKLSALQHTWSLFEWIVAVMGPASFLVGIFIATAVNVGVPLCSLPDMRRLLRSQPIRHDRLFVIIVLSFLLYIVSFVIISYIKGYIPLFTLNPAAARLEYFVFGIGLFIHNMPIIVFFAIIYSLSPGSGRTRKRIIFAVGTVTLLTYFLLLQRYQLIMIAVMVFTVLYYVSNWISWKSMLSFVAAGILAVYSIATLRAGQLVAMFLYTSSQMRFSARYAIFTEPYMYIAMNVENLVRAVSHLDRHSYGYYTLDFVLALTGLKYPLKEYFGLVDYPHLISGYNTYTLFWTFYRDFGFAGISILQLAAGLLIGLIYYRMRQRPTIGLVTTYSFLVFLMVLSFFLSPIGFLWFVYIAISMWIIWLLIRVRQRPAAATA